KALGLLLDGTLSNHLVKDLHLPPLQLAPNRVLVAGLSMGGELATYVAALYPEIAMAIPAGYSPDIGVSHSHNHTNNDPIAYAHACWRWINAEMLEYIDASDLHALIAPRPLIVHTGLPDTTYSPRDPPFSADKQVARRSRVAYAVEARRFV